MKTWKSHTLTPRQLVILVFSGAVFGAFLAFFALRGFRGRDAWMLLGEDTALNVGLILLIGLVLSAGYFYRDFRLYDQTSMTIKKDKLVFSSPRFEDRTFSMKEMRQIRTARPMYSWFGYRKIIMQFKSLKDFRRYQQLLLIKSEDEATLTQDLKTAREKALPSKKVSPKT